jgi:AmmeMemoRadiSam system protein B
MGATPTRVRPPAVAGLFFEGDPRRCADETRRLCVPRDDVALPPRLHGALVPHAGWIYSGRIAGAALATLVARTDARTVVLTGTMHRARRDGPVADGADAWVTPLGPVDVDVRLRDALVALDGFDADDGPHEAEHSLEVQVPLLQALLGDELRIVPLLVPTRDGAGAWGEAVGRALLAWSAPVIVVASSDLTHYGPRFDFTPAGRGAPGRRWAHDTNDRELLDAVERMQPDEIVRHAVASRSACGAGAIALAVTACRTLGATGGHLLEHTDSAREHPDADADAGAGSVGYAGVVFG